METFKITQETKLQQAQEHVEKLKGFYSHLSIYLLFIPIFIAVNYFGGSNFPWAIFPIVGWGIGITGHAFETYKWSPFFGKNWEERKIREFMNS
ncbi:2TM domain-containing protein [Rasiella sp. SM2506]|uniref:2TM domain-containing protein n=1 Tax=Rasiella sp. SM2506 TaxID=3423914 RepID=UPI003D7C0195